MGALACTSSTRATEKKRIFRAIADIVADIVADGGKYSYRPNKCIDFVIALRLMALKVSLKDRYEPFK